MVNKHKFMVPIKPKGLEKDGLSIIILSGSPGYRMRSYGPRCLLKDKYGVTILQNQTNSFTIFKPKAEIILVSGFELDKVVKNKPAGVRIVENQLYEDTNEVEEARLGINNALYDNILLTFGDIYFNDFLIRDLALKESTLVVDQKNSMLSDDVGVTVVDEYATIMSFAIRHPKWCRFAFFTGRELKLLKAFISDRNNNKLYLFEALNFIMEKGGKFKAFYTKPVHNVIHVDSAKGLEKIQ
jgi:hypothetical protein